MKYKFIQFKSYAGFTLIEVLIAFVIIAVLSTLGVTNVLSFQKDAKLESTEDEFAGQLINAKNKSVNGEIANGMVLSDFDENYLPHWIIKNDGDRYELYSSYVLSDGTSAESNHDVYYLLGGGSISPTVNVDFERISGKTTPTCFDITIPNYSKTGNVYVDAMGNVSKTCP